MSIIPTILGAAFGKCEAVHCKMIQYILGQQLFQSSGKTSTCCTWTVYGAKRVCMEPN